MKMVDMLTDYNFAAMEENDVSSNPLIVHLEPGDKEIAEYFLQKARAYCCTMQEALKNNGIITVEVISHNLKGTGGTLGFPAISEFADLIHSAIHQKDLAKASQKIAKLQYYLDRLKVIYE